MGKKKFYNVDVEKASIGDYSTSQNTEQDRIGFISYDSEVMRQMSTPPVIYPLGAYQQALLDQEDPWTIPYAGSKYNLNHVDYERARHAIPGIMTYEVEHILGTVDPPVEIFNGIDPSQDIFVNKWTQMRILDNMVKNYEAGDIKTCQVGIMELQAHITNLYRILEIVRSVVQHSENFYFREDTLLQALGFPMTAMEARSHWAEWFQFYNQNIVGLFNAITWMQGIVPGEKRWASLYREIYKDTDANTNYAQIYLLKPRYLWAIEYLYDEEDHEYYWSFKKEYYEFDESDVTRDTGVKALTLYLSKVHDAIRSLLYNEDTSQIRATFEAIVKRNSSTAEDLHLARMNMPTIEFAGPEPELKFDFKLMIALHNATILNGLILSPPSVDSATGRMTQRVHAGDPSDALQMSWMNKVIDMPVVGVNSDDMMNATQWTVVTQKPGHMAHGLNAYEIGTDAITGVRIFRINDSNPMAPRMNYTDTIGFYIDKREDIFVDNFSSQTKEQLRNYYNTYDYTIYKMIQSMQWNLSPIWYYLKTKIALPESVADAHPVHYLEYVATQSEVLYVASYRSLSAMHQQWLYAFWGYPGAIGQKAKDVPKFSEDVKLSSSAIPTT